MPRRIPTVRHGAGFWIVATGAVLPQIELFIGGGVVAGLGVGLLFTGAISTAVSLADPKRTGETLALIFVVASAGLAIPALLVGGALAFEPATAVLLVFVILVLAATVTAGTLMRCRGRASIRQ